MVKQKSKYSRGTHPNTQKALKEHGFKPGRSGNPNGRPTNELSITNVCRDMLPQVCPFDSEGRTWAQYIAYRMMAQSIQNVNCLRELLERLEGKVTQPIEGTITTDVNFTIGKGYANGKPDIQSDKQDSG